MRPGLVPGYNVDHVDISAGLREAVELGYGDPTVQMVVTYALQRHQRGEEEGARKTWLSQYPRDLTSFLAIVASAASSGQAAADAAGIVPQSPVELDWGARTVVGQL